MFFTIMLKKRKSKANLLNNQKIVNKSILTDSFLNTFCTQFFSSANFHTGYWQVHANTILNKNPFILLQNDPTRPHGLLNSNSMHICRWTWVSTCKYITIKQTPIVNILFYKKNAIKQYSTYYLFTFLTQRPKFD